METYRLPEGRIMIEKSDKKQSVGYLELKQNQELDKHNRPVDEKLTQIEGTSTMILFDDNNQTKEVILEPGNELIIPAKQFHIHANKTETKSLTKWEFDGDIQEIIENIRVSFQPTP